MRYLSLTGFVVVAGAVAAFACGDGDSANTGSAGAAGKAGSGGTGASAGKGGSGGKAGAAGKAGAGDTGGTGAEAGAPGGAAGEAGEPAGGGAGLGGGAGGSSGGTSGAGGAGAGGTGGSGGQTQALDSLAVTLSGVPAGATAAVNITGPANFVQNIAATTTLTGLAAGSYAISAPPIRVPGTQVDAIYDSTVTGTPAAVTLAAASNATVAYSRRPGTGTMWATNALTHNAYSFDAAAIAKTGSQTDAPGVSLNLIVGSGGPATQAIAFSATGDLWVSTCKSPQTPQVLAKYAPGKISASGNPVADVTITLPATDTSYDCADALAFDSTGNLWVGLYKGRILKYSATDLTVTGTPAPAVNLSSTYFNGALDLAFDSAGNLFVAAYNVPVISRLSAAQLATTASALVPAVILTLGNAGAGPGGLVLASDGSLWVADYNQGGASSRIFKFSAADLGATGTPTPALTLSGVQGPEQMAFDKAGNLWVTSYDSATVVALAAGDLTTSGAKSPLTTLTGDGAFSTPFALRFNPGSP